ncbi:MAG: type III-A CRISPR-associated RAMP protein Csm5 [Candidatus Woesearchaeota archaeon]
METIRLKLKIKTPLLISSGEILCPFDYYIEERDDHKNYCFVLDLENFIEEIMNVGEEMDLELFMNLFLEEIRNSIKNNKFTKNMKEILESIGKRNLLRKNFNYNYILEKSKRFSFSTMNKKEDIKTTLELPILTKENRPYLPGSSIKGAIKTALFFKYISEKKENNSVQKLSYLLKKYLQIKAKIVGKKNNNYSKELKEISEEIKKILNIFESDMKNINFIVRDVPLENFSFEIYRIERMNRKKFGEKNLRLSSAIFINEGEGLLKISCDDEMISNFKKIYPHFTSFKELLFESMKEFYNEVSKRINDQWERLITFDFSEGSIPIQLGKYGNLYTKSIAVYLLDKSYIYPKTISYIEYNNQKVQPGWVELKEV